MNQVFQPFIGKFIVIYFDGSLIYTRSKEEHLQHLWDIFTVLRGNNLYVNLKKYSFLTDILILLGYVVMLKVSK